MKINFSIDENIDGIIISIKANKYDNQVKNIVSLLEKLDVMPEKLIGEKQGKLYFLDPDLVYSIFSLDGSVYIRTESEEFLSKDRLYELEEKLKGNFVRISKSALVNIGLVKSLEMEFNGKMKLYLLNGQIEYTSRNYLKQIKKALGLK